MTSDYGRSSPNISSAKPVDVKPVSHGAAQSPDMVERVARAIAYSIAKRRNEGEEPTEPQVAAWLSVGVRKDAQAALEASHHAEAVHLLSRAKALLGVGYTTAPASLDGLETDINTLLAKIGGDA